MKIEKVIERIFTTLETLPYLEYEYDLISDTHFVRVPRKYYDSEDFIQIESEMSNEWLGSNLDFLCFLTDDSIYQLKKPTTLPNFNLQDSILQHISNFGGYPKNTEQKNASPIVPAEGVYFSDGEILEEPNYAQAA